MNKDIENDRLIKELDVKFFGYRNNCIKIYFLFLIKIIINPSLYKLI